MDFKSPCKVNPLTSSKDWREEKLLANIVVMHTGSTVHSIIGLLVQTFHFLWKTVHWVLTMFMGSWQPLSGFPSQRHQRARIHFKCLFSFWFSEFFESFFRCQNLRDQKKDQRRGGARMDIFSRNLIYGHLIRFSSCWVHTLKQNT